MPFCKMFQCKGFVHHSWKLVDIQFNETGTSYLTTCSHCEVMHVLDGEQFREKNKYNLIRGV